jgi:C1A family cysteine protease
MLVSVSRQCFLIDRPDSRDYTSEQPAIAAELDRRRSLKGDRQHTPPSSYTVSDINKITIKQQFRDATCTAQVAVSLLEFHKFCESRKTQGKHAKSQQFSPSFVYYCGRKLMSEKERNVAGCYSRLAMQSLVLFGAPPSTFYPYNKPFVNESSDYEAPDAFCFSAAQNFQALMYYRLDKKGKKRNDQLLDSIKLNLWLDLPLMFGKIRYFHDTKAGCTGEFLFEADDSRQTTGHAMMAIGYDDKKRVSKSVGALRVRNSAGNSWGDNGEAWLPYDHVTNGRTVDWWSLIRAEDVNLRDFE